jgi:hypothetical protein
MLGSSRFSLVPGGESSSFALCFGIFALHLTGRHRCLARRREEWIETLLQNLPLARRECCDIHTDKPYRQLLTLSLSALSILGGIRADGLAQPVLEQVAQDTAANLKASGALDGLPQSGNQALFQAILLLHAGRYLGRSTRAALDQWVTLHTSSMNRFGFWGSDAGPTHLHFQNGYHQYEIFEYLGVVNARESRAVQAVASLADRHGHYAPYPGGGACFDYDAVFLLTPNGRVAPEEGVAELLTRTFDTLLREQHADGGFCENRWLRPRHKTLPGYVERILSARNPAVLKERVRYAITLQAPRHDRLQTHWSKDARRWSDSDLFSSWFRLLALARIECAFSPERASSWGFINYPGIGWHPSLRRLEASGRD